VAAHPRDAKRIRQIRNLPEPGGARALNLGANIVPCVCSAKIKLQWYQKNKKIYQFFAYIDYNIFISQKIFSDGIFNKNSNQEIF